MAETTNLKLTVLTATDTPSWLTDFNGNMDKIDDFAGNQNTANSTVNTQITEIQAHDDLQDTQIDSLTTRVSACETKNTQQDARLDAVEGDVNTLQNDVITQNTAVKQLQTDVSQLKTKVNDIEGELDTHAGDITALQADVQTASSKAINADAKSDQAVATANGASQTATQAKSTADSANDVAGRAWDTANTANTSIQQTQGDVNKLKSDLEDVASNVTANSISINSLSANLSNDILLNNGHNVRYELSGQTPALSITSDSMPKGSFTDDMCVLFSVTGSKTDTNTLAPQISYVGNVMLPLLTFPNWLNNNIDFYLPVTYYDGTSSRIQMLAFRMFVTDQLSNNTFNVSINYVGNGINPLIVNSTTEIVMSVQIKRG